ncbi:hypothetical protein DRJ25_05630 [Candidatus Woesearchaeota archaeon]|nr:MAG: hypothetical protein DRJ25_05630 [Candidatus Woesearchaeota archaeon]
MTKIIRISSDEGVKYVTFELDEDFIKNFQEFLSDIGIGRDRRKNLFKKHFVNVRAGGKMSGDYSGTLQVTENKEKTIKIEIFTSNTIVIVAIHHSGKDAIIGDALRKNFKFEE